MGKYITPQQLVARWEGMIREKTLANWRSTGEGPRYTKIGGRVVYSEVAVEEYERERERRTNKAA